MYGCVPGFWAHPEFWFSLHMPPRNTTHTARVIYYGRDVRRGHSAGKKYRSDRKDNKKIHVSPNT